MSSAPESPPLSSDAALRMLRKAFETTQLGVTVTDPGGKILFTNRAEAEMHGYRVDELVGRDVRIFAPRELWKPLAASELKRLRSRSRETVNVRADGEVFPVELLSDVVLGDDGEPIAVVTTCRDLTRPKQMRQTVRILEKALETTQLGVTISDPQGKILYTNRAEAEMHGYRRSELIGRDARILAPAELSRPMGRGKLRRLRSRRRDTINVRRDGSRFPAHLLSDVVLGDDGEPIAVVTTCEDISARRQAEEDHRALEEQLRQAQKMEAMGQLAGGVAHDFNNLLVVIQGNATFALDGMPEDSPWRQHLGQVLDASQRAAGLTRQLLALGRRQVLEPAALDLNEALTEFIHMLRRVLGEHIELHLVTAPGLWTVLADRGQIEQVLMNLCVNARDAMPEGGRITLATRNVEVAEAWCETRPWARPGRFVLLSVSDSGCGMDEDTLSRIFEPFYTTKEPGVGTGLGLATVYGIVQQHEGMIEVESSPGGGATFDVYLPFAEIEVEPVREREPRDVSGDGETILLAEDDDMVRDTVSQLLELAGYRVLLAADGRQAVELFEAHADEVALVFMDMVMPVLGGAAASEEILAIRAGARFLFATGYSFHDAGRLPLDRDRRFPLINKPYDRQQLLRLLRELLEAGEFNPGG